jgi:hypothetical protein
MPPGRHGEWFEGSGLTVARPAAGRSRAITMSTDSSSPTFCRSAGTAVRAFPESAGRGLIPRLPYPVSSCSRATAHLAQLAGFLQPTRIMRPANQVSCEGASHSSCIVSSIQHGLPGHGQMWKPNDCDVQSPPSAFPCREALASSVAGQPSRSCAACFSHTAPRHGAPSAFRSAPAGRSGAVLGMKEPRAEIMRSLRGHCLIIARPPALPFQYPST